MADTTQLVDSLKSQLSQVKARYQEGGVGGVVKMGLAENQELLQSWYNKILEQKGVLSEDEKKRLEELLTSNNKKLLEDSAKRTKTTLLLIGVGVIVAVGALIYIFKFRSRHAKTTG